MLEVMLCVRDELASGGQSPRKVIPDRKRHGSKRWLGTFRMLSNIDRLFH